ncbi:Predicted membrane protein [Paracidovorax konjaci]|uniref:Predicted membrane protein n=1 Tax=Paracidovorax konjaci TaxID=32040 RepID=A0A1I1RL44_9BURK|nr:Predicted membrane protein [Paracidovorax konjaci]
MTGADAAGWRTRVVLVALAGAMVAMPLLKYQALASNWFDLGLFESVFYAYAQEGGTGHAFFGHVQPFMGLYAHVYLWLGPLGLLALQGLALAALPAWGVWRQYGPWPALALLLYYPLWANALFDFHFDHLAVPLLLGFYVAYERRRIAWAMACALLLAWVKEPFALQTAACGVFLIWQAWRHRAADPLSRRWAMAGGVLVAAGLAWFYVATQWLIPHFTGSSGGLDADAFTWLGQGLGSMVGHLVAHPWLPVTEALANPGKLLYLFICFGLLAFIPLLSPQWLIPALPPLLIAMLARSENYYSYGNHYTAGLIAPLIVAFAHGMPVFQRICSRCGLSSVATVRSLCFVLLVGHAMFAPSPLGRLFWSDKVWSYSKQAYWPDARTQRIKSAIAHWIPRDPGVSVATQNPLNWGHLPRREAYFAFPDGVFDAKAVPGWTSGSAGWRVAPARMRHADYVVLDEKRPWFLLDQGCLWLHGRCTDEAAAQRYRGAVAEVRKRYALVYEDDGFSIFRRTETP